MNFFKTLFKKKEPIHVHTWRTEYRTGKSINGKSTVVSCECGQWAVHHYGTKEYVLLDPIKKQ